MGGGGDIPIVARPPNFIRPKRRKGTESVVTPGTRSRMTITSSGCWGMSLDVILRLRKMQWVYCGRRNSRRDGRSML